MTELASVLLSRGVTSAVFSELAKRSFITAAARRSTLRNGRINQSQVSVLTGLRRGEVRRVLSTPHLTPAHKSPLDGVMAGWCTDARFSHPDGTPRRLRFKGARNSFAVLVRSYAGDVPPRAVLNELREMGVARQSGTFVEVKSLGRLRRRRSLASLSTLMPVLVDGVRVAAGDGRARSSSFMRRVVLPAKSLSELELVRSRCASSVNSMIHGLESSLSGDEAAPKAGRRRSHSCSVTILLTEHRLDKSNPFSSRPELIEPWRGRP